MLKKDLFLAYQDVFTNDGKIKACGREKCSKLILMCQEFDSNTYYGDPETGFMNPGAINDLCKKFFSAD